MTSSVGAGSKSRDADALVVFGITGDLAKVMTFRSLYRLEARGLLDCPIVGVAVDDWTDRDLREHAREAIATASGEKLDDKVFDRLGERLSYVQGDFADAETYERVADEIEEREEPGLLPRDPAVPVRNGRSRASPAPASPKARGSSWRSRSATTSRRRAQLAAEVHRYIDESQLYRIDHFLGKMGLGRDPLPALRQRDLRAGLEPEAHRVRADHDGRGLRRRGPRPLLRPGRRAARRRRQPPHAGGRRGGDGAAGRARPARAEGRDVRRLPRDAGRRSRAVRARPVRRLPRDRRRRRGLDYRDLRGAAAARSTTGAGPACRSSSAPGKLLPVTADGGPARVQAAAPARASGRPRSREPEPDQLVIKLDPSTGIQAAARRPARRRRRARADQPRHGVRRRRAARAPTPYEVLLHAAMVGDSMRFTRQDNVEETWRIMEPLLDDPPPSTPTNRDRGGRGQPTSWSPATAAGTALARVMSETKDNAPSTGRGDERRGPLAVPADRRVRVPLGLPHRRARRPRRVDRLALRAALRLAERLRQPARPRGRAASGSGRSASTCRRPGTTSRARTSLLTTWHTPTRVGDRPRRADDGTAPRRGHGHAAHPAPQPTRTPSTCSSARSYCLDGQRRDRAGLRAGLRLRARRRPSGRSVDGERHIAPTRAAAGLTDAAARPTSRSASRATASAAGTRSSRASRHLLRALLGGGVSARPGPSTRPTRGSRRPPGSGVDWLERRPHPRPPLARGRSSARRWRSRASPTCRPAPPSPPSPPRCPRRPAASATGTTATPGCATRPSPCRRCTSSTSTGRRTSSCSSSPTSSPTRTARCRSCTGSTGGAT